MKVREILSLRIDQLELENKQLRIEIALQRKSLELDSLMINFQLENPGMVLDKDFNLQKKEEN